MPSTYTNILRLELQADGENDGTWGQILNDNVIALIEDAIAGTADVSTTGGTTALSTNDGAEDQARKRAINVTGSLASDAIIEVPAQTKPYRVINGTSGSFTVEVLVSGQSAGDGVVVPQGARQEVWCDGTNVEPTSLPLDDSGVAQNFASTGIDDNASTTIITIKDSENVGINDNDPAAPLTVAGDVIFGSTSNVVDDLTFLGNEPPQLTVSYTIPGTPSWTANASTELLVMRDGDTRASIIANNSNTAELAFGDQDIEKQGFVNYDNSSDSLTFGLSGLNFSRIVSTGPVADDDTATVTPPRNGCMVAMVTDGFTGFPRNSGWFFGYIDVGNSVDAAEFNTGALITIDTSNTTPTGTTGADGDITLFLQSNGTIIVENREGGEQSFLFTFI